MYLFTGGRFLDPRQDEFGTGWRCWSRASGCGDRTGDRSRAGATRVDVGDRTVMPGLIDAHVHAFLPGLNIGRLMNMPLTLLGLRGGGVPAADAAPGIPRRCGTAEEKLCER